MLTKKLNKSLNEQMNLEFYSAYFYLSMSSWFSTEELAGFANWFRVQAQEELFHAMKTFDYINGAGGHALTTAIKAPQTDFNSIQQVFELTLEHERFVTSFVNKLLTQVRKESDHATDIFLQWFVSEQVEEEASVSAILKKVSMVGDDGRGILMLDNEFASRVFTAPSTA